MRHTPGPWNLRQIGTINDNQWAIEGVGCFFIPEYANARLIAQAPAMLDELKHLVSLLEPIEKGGMHIPGLATLNKAKAIIRAAEGE